MLFGIYDGVDHYNIDRSKINVYIQHSLKEYNETTERFTKVKTRYELRLCREDDFLADEFEIDY